LSASDDILATGLTIGDVQRMFPLVRKAPDDPGARITTALWLTGEALDAAACTQAAGVAPTKVLEKRIRGHFVPSGRPNVLDPSWMLEVCHEPSYDVDACVAALLALVHPRAKDIRELVAREGYRANFETSVTIFEDAPRYGLSASTLERLAAFGFDWGLDIL
jgi:hypothetical protein